MANSMRWRYGETNPVMMPVASPVVIEIGDLVILDSGLAQKASSIVDQGTAAANQEALHDQFLGVAMQASPLDSAEPIRIATSGVFEFDCSASTFELGDLIGGSEDTLGTELVDQMVEGVGSANLAIGRCVKRVPSAGTKIFLEIVSTVLRGGPQAAA